MRLPLLLPTVLLAACGGGDQDAGPPNVLLVTLDTTRPDYLSCYSEARQGTPTLQGIADAGARFDLALSSSGVTPVSHATILTGAFPHEHGLRVLSAGSGFRLAKDQATIASLLRDRGYQTASIQSAFPVSRYFGFEKDYDVFHDMAGEMVVDEERGKTIWNGDELQRRSDATAAQVLEYLDDARSDGRPFFLWLHLWDPHDPWIKPPDDYLEGLTITDDQFAASTQLYSQIYYAEVKFMDHQLGVVLDGLEERGQLEDTLLCVTADHGEGLGDGFSAHGWSKHRMTYQVQLHVPLLLQGPGVPAGATFEDMVRTADITPTLLDLAGFAGSSPGGSGRSLVPMLEGEAMEPALAYADQVNGYDANASMVQSRPDAAFLHTVCDGEWKLIYRPHMFEQSELFNIRRDPRERRNVIAQNSDVYLRLMGELAVLDPWVLEPFPLVGEGFDSDVAAGLSKIGYGGGDGGDTGDWWWTCPAHPNYRRDTREGPGGSKRHSVQGCEHPVVPRTTFTPKPAKQDR